MTRVTNPERRRGRQDPWPSRAHVRERVPCVITQRILGHKGLKMLSEIYSHPTPSDLTKAMMKALKGKE
jgi:hypothetical protein